MERLNAGSCENINIKTGGIMKQLMVFPEDEYLQQEIKELKRIIEERIAEIYEIKYILSDKLINFYYREIAPYELKLMNLSDEFNDLMTKRNRLQDQIDGVALTLTDNAEVIIEQIILEFLKNSGGFYEEYLEGRDQREELPLDEEKELKKLYRFIVKKLHPDLNPHASYKDIELFHLATESYKCGDLETLRTIYYHLTEEWSSEVEVLEKSELLKEKKRLEERLSALDKELQELKENPPYTFKKYMDDEAEKERYIKETIELTDECKEKIQLLKEEIKVLEGKLRCRT